VFVSVRCNNWFERSPGWRRGADRNSVGGGVPASDRDADLGRRMGGCRQHKRTAQRGGSDRRLARHRRVGSVHAA
jgi:hypothetical protein